MFDKMLHRKLLTDDLEGKGVITERKVVGAKNQFGVMGFYVAVEGHIKFGDGTEASFSSRGLDTYKVDILNVGTIAAADAAVARGDKSGHHERSAGTK